MRPPASATAVGDPGSLAPYWRFNQAVAEAQLASWLPRRSHLLIDISGPQARAAQIAAAAGHTVLRVTGTVPGPRDGFPPDGSPPNGSRSEPTADAAASIPDAGIA